MHELMKQVLKKEKGEDFEGLYAELKEARKLRDIYSAEEAQEVQKQFAMMQNFVKMIDKQIDTMELD